MSLTGDSPEQMAYRVCNKCRERKPVTEYYRDKGRRDPLKRHPVCKVCLKKTSGIVTRLKKTAPPKPAVCECCGRDPNTEPICRGWCLDHDYKTEEFRGWICQTCNIGLGHFGDSVQGLMKGIDYLRRTDKETR